MPFDFGTDFHHPTAILGDVDQGDGLLVQPVIAGLDAAQISTQFAR